MGVYEDRCHGCIRDEVLRLVCKARSIGSSVGKRCMYSPNSYTGRSNARDKCCMWGMNLKGTRKEMKDCRAELKWNICRRKNGSQQCREWKKNNIYESTISCERQSRHNESPVDDAKQEEKRSAAWSSEGRQLSRTKEKTGKWNHKEKKAWERGTQAVVESRKTVILKSLKWYCPKIRVSMTTETLKYFPLEVHENINITVQSFMNLSKFATYHASRSRRTCDQGPHISACREHWAEVILPAHFEMIFRFYRSNEIQFPCATVLQQSQIWKQRNLGFCSCFDSLCLSVQLFYCKVRRLYSLYKIVGKIFTIITF